MHHGVQTIYFGFKSLLFGILQKFGYCFNSPPFLTVVAQFFPGVSAAHGAFMPANKGRSPCQVLGIKGWQLHDTLDKLYTFLYLAKVELIHQVFFVLVHRFWANV
jgi:hypothetical protein